jgi:hypothetical protein
VTSSSRQWLILLAVVALGPVSAEAQTLARSFEELRGIVKAEEPVIVTDMRGRSIKGALTTVDDDSLLIVTGGRTQTFTRSEVNTVRVADGLGNGALIGAAAGLGAALGILAIAGSGNGYVLPLAKVGAPFLLSGIGALVGVLVDRAHPGGRVLYRSHGGIQKVEGGK